MVDLNYKRFPTSEKSISEITPEDIRVGIIGTVIDVSDDKIMIDDGTGTIEVILDEENLKKVSQGKLVRIIGRVASDGGMKINGEIVQDFSGFDIELYNKIKELEQKI